MAEIKNVKYEKRERKPSTDRSPTMGSLLGSKEKKVKVDIPLKTAAFDIAYEPIQLNAHSRYEPGKSYLVHPIIAEELERAKKNYEESIILQVSNRNKAGIEQFDGEFRPDELIQIS